MWLQIIKPVCVINSELAYSVNKEGDMIKIECLKMGIVVMTNGKYIMIQVCSRYIRI